MAEKVEYKVISSTCAETLNYSVNKHIEEGWEFYGYPFAGGGGGSAHFCQGMIRCVEVPEETMGG